MFGDRYAALDAADRLEALDVLSVGVVDPDPEGTRAQRVRHYVVNELLYAFYRRRPARRSRGWASPPAIRAEHGRTGRDRTHERGRRRRSGRRW
ncbi:hypothetical protein ACFQRB_20620 [Halobaculum litoreum]|uniref:Uncharacterized protein n=1 Tax=Halobaculum litoreum TaxID=3031998 RepID=A0ABD5XSX6_9EURY